MSFFDKIVEQLFPRRHTENVPVLEEALERNQDFRHKMFLWQNSGAHHRLAYQFWEAWQLKKNQQLADFQVHILKINGSNGIAFTYHPQIGPEPFQFFFDYLRDKTLQIGYQLYTSDRRIYLRSHYTETVEKHYLKPPIDLRVENGKFLPCNQLYGNVLIEYVQIDDQPSFIRLMAHYYQDSLYQPPLPFDDFVKNVLL
ncbi:MAG: hypothetical protein RMJ44_02105 [Cytophagales bacterium]|nr:hypothetical protein [Bernardetiaceae bacterium]MDW8209853.1 hypothetical protein [Cytophagales bacterium]